MYGNFCTTYMYENILSFLKMYLNYTKIIRETSEITSLPMFCGGQNDISVYVCILHKILQQKDKRKENCFTELIIYIF
jgi:hypothetical protein